MVAGSAAAVNHNCIQRLAGQAWALTIWRCQIAIQSRSGEGNRASSRTAVSSRIVSSLTLFNAGCRQSVPSRSPGSTVRGPITPGSLGSHPGRAGAKGRRPGRRSCCRPGRSREERAGLPTAPKSPSSPAARSTWSPAWAARPAPSSAPGAPSNWVAYPAWSSDGKRIAYVENSVVFVRPVDGGPAARLAAVDFPHSIAGATDGEWIALVSGNAAFTFGAHPWGSPTNLGNVAPSSIWLVPSRGGSLVRITDDASLNTSPAWLPGGRGLLFVPSRLGSR